MLSIMIIGTLVDFFLVLMFHICKALHGMDPTDVMLETQLHIGE